MNTTFYRWLDQIFFSHQTAIIMYHGLTDQDDQLENYHGKHLHIQTFKKHLEYLKKYYSIIPLDTFVEHVLTKTTLPKNAVVLTFDDGYESNFTLGFPLLKEFNAPATIFLTTDFIEQKQFIWPNRIEYAILTTRHSSLRMPIKNEELVFDLNSDEAKKKAINDIKILLKSLDHTQRLEFVDEMEKSLEQKLMFNETTPLTHRALSWPQIQEMSQSNLITFGAHTCSHPILALCTSELMDKEITTPKKIIEEKLNKNCPLFCYPYGGEDSFNEQTKKCVQEAGFCCALTTITGTNDALTDLFTLKRLGTSNLVGMDNFENKLLNSRRTLDRLRKKLF